MTNNSSYDRSQDGEDGQINAGWSHSVLYFAVSTWAILYLISITGNTWVLIVCCKRLKFLGIRSYYFFSLALADLIFTLSTLFYVLNIVLPVTIFTNVTCKLFYYVINTSHGASVFNLLLLTYNRYVAVMWPLRAFTSQTKSKVRKTLYITWLLALFPYLPLLFFYTVNKGESHRRSRCSQTGPPFVTSLYYALLTLLMYLLPLVTIIVAYSKICVRLCFTSNRIGTFSTYGRRRKAIKLVIIIVSLFFFLWTPFNVMLVVIFVFRINSTSLHMAWAISTLLVLVNASINPWVYLIMGRRKNGPDQNLTPIISPEVIRLRKITMKDC